MTSGKALNHRLLHADLDYQFRLNYYWAAPLSVLDTVLRNVKGTPRRAMITDYFHQGQLEELLSTLTTEELSEPVRASRRSLAQKGSETLLAMPGEGLRMRPVKALVGQDDLLAFCFKDRRQALVTVAGAIMDAHLVIVGQGKDAMIERPMSRSGKRKAVARIIGPARFLADDVRGFGLHVSSQSKTETCDRTSIAVIGEDYVAKSSVSRQTVHPIDRPFLLHYGSPVLQSFKPNRSFNEIVGQLTITVKVSDYLLYMESA